MATRRAEHHDYILDTDGRPIASASIYVYQVDTTTPITETIYADATGADELTNPLSTNSLGYVQFYLDRPKIVDLLVSKTGYTDFTLEDVSVARTGSYSATCSVASSTALDSSKAQADYTASGTADDVDINAATTAAGAGKVELTEGEFACVNPIPLGEHPLLLEGAGPPSFIQKFAPTLLRFDLAAAGTPFEITTTNSGTRGPVTLSNLGIEGVGNVTDGIVLSTECHNCELNRILLFGTFTNAAVRNTSGCSQNRLINVYTRDVQFAFDLDGEFNYSEHLEALRGSGVGVGTGTVGFRFRDNNSYAGQCVAERYVSGMEFGTGGAGSVTGSTFVNMSVAQSTGGLNLEGINNCIFFGGIVDGCTHATNAAVILNVAPRVTITGMTVQSSTSGKSFSLGVNSKNVSLLGNFPRDTTPYVLTTHPIGLTIIDPVDYIDPGASGAIPVNRGSGSIALVTAGAETRTLAAPGYIGQELMLYCKTYVGDCVVTCATTVNEAGDNTITFTATGQACRLYAVEEGSNLRWRLASVDGAALSTV